MRKIFYQLIFITPFLLFSCHPAYRSQGIVYKNYAIQSPGVADSEMGALMKPYSDSVNRNMNDGVGMNGMLLEKKTGDCTLGYFMADAYLRMANLKYNTKVDAAFMNYGGIRLTEIPPGKITRGKLYELMPFDNMLLLQKVKGTVLRQYLDTRNETDAACMAGITMRVKNKMVYQVLVDGRPLEEDAEYVIANSDFIINNSPVLKPIPVQNINYLQRDALIDYVSSLTREGKKITVNTERRVSYDQ